MSFDLNRHKGTKKSKIIEKYFGGLKKVRTFAVPNVKNDVCATNIPE